MACRPLLTHDPSTTRRISRLSNRLTKRGCGTTRDCTDCSGKCVSGARVESCGWKTVAGTTRLCRPRCRAAGRGPEAVEMTIVEAN